MIREFTYFFQFHNTVVNIQGYIMNHAAARMVFSCAHGLTMYLGITGISKLFKEKTISEFPL